jgi:hypothetical protein
LCYREGRRATQEELVASITSGLPILLKQAVEEGGGALKSLRQHVKEAMIYLNLQGAKLEQLLPTSA